MHLSYDRELEYYKGTLALRGNVLSLAHAFYAPLTAVPSFPLHISLLSPAEYKQVGRPRIRDVRIPVHHVYALGLGQTAHKVQWLVVCWNHANQWRAEMGLPIKQFHITLSPFDDHDAHKGIDSLLSGNVVRAAVLEQVARLGVHGVDHAVVASAREGMVSRLVSCFLCHDSYTPLFDTARRAGPPCHNPLSRFVPRISPHGGVGTAQ